MAALHENAAGLSEMVTALAGVEICKEPWRIYYDETENCRSIAYRNGAIADARTVERTFILGGIAILGEGAENELSARIETSCRHASNPSLPEAAR